MLKSLLGIQGGRLGHTFMKVGDKNQSLVLLNLTHDESSEV